MSPATYRALSASARGAAHIRRGAPNQDFAGWEALAEGGYALAVADGHGADLHARSADGARFAVEACLAEMRAAWAGRADALPNAPATEAEAILTAVLALWRDKVDAAIAANPLEKALAAQSDAAGLGIYGPYGTTLVAALLWPGGGLAFQVGDGNVLIRDGTGQLAAPIADDLRQGEETASLCEPDAQLSARFAVIGPWRDAVLASDGFAKSFSDRDAIANGAAAMLDLIAAGAKPAAVESDLAALSAQGSGDDISLAALVSDARPATVTPASPALTERGKSGRGWLLVAIMLLLAALLGRHFIGPPPKAPPAAAVPANPAKPNVAPAAGPKPKAGQAPKTRLPSVHNRGGNDAGQSKPDPK
jgi:hypothetical protein